MLGAAASLGEDFKEKTVDFLLVRPHGAGIGRGWVGGQGYVS